jgi:hypothetical protein
MQSPTEEDDSAPATGSMAAPTTSGSATIADSGVDRTTGDWSPAFEGQRPPADAGNDLAVKHGAYADVRLGPRVDELADDTPL